MEFEISRTISADHPSLPGHFPGAPIVPGVMILDEVAAALSQWLPHARITGIPVAKFLAPLQPEQPFTISLAMAQTGEAHVDFRCSAQDGTVAAGRLEIERKVKD
jgi:3-hydroxyacyl-[acyl-carrier-protein] dehydratase